MQPSPVLLGAPDTTRAAESHAGQGAGHGAPSPPHQAAHKKPFPPGSSESVSLGTKAGQSLSRDWSKERQERAFHLPQATHLEPSEPSQSQHSSFRN